MKRLLLILFLLLLIPALLVAQNQKFRTPVEFAESTYFNKSLILLGGSTGYVLTKQINGSAAWAAPTGGSGSVGTGGNVGTGFKIYKNKTDTTLWFKTLTANTGILIDSSVSNQIRIGVDTNVAQKNLTKTWYAKQIFNVANSGGEASIEVYNPSTAALSMGVAATLNSASSSATSMALVGTNQGAGYGIWAASVSGTAGAFSTTSGKPLTATINSIETFSVNPGFTYVKDSMYVNGVLKVSGTLRMGNTDSAATRAYARSLASSAFDHTQDLFLWGDQQFRKIGLWEGTAQDTVWITLDAASNMIFRDIYRTKLLSDLISKQDSATFLAYTKYLITIATPDSSVYATRYWSNNTFLKNADSTSLRNQSNALYIAKADTATWVPTWSDINAMNYGDITGVSVTTPITGGGSSGGVTIGADTSTAATGLATIARVTLGLAGKQASGVYLVPADSGYIRTYSNFLYPAKGDTTTWLPTWSDINAMNYGDITSVSTNTPITGGAMSGAITLSADTSTAATGLATIARVTLGLAGKQASGNYVLATDTTTWLPTWADINAMNYGDITSVSTNTPITGGATSGAITLSADTSTAATGLATIARVILGLAGKQPLDSDLTTLAGLTPTDNNMILAASSAWSSANPATVKTALALQNVTNESKSTMFTSPTFTGSPTFTLTSDATGDMFYRNSSGYFTRLGLGTTGYHIRSNGTIPTWAASDTAGLGTSLSGKQPLDADLTTIAGLTPTTGNMILSVGGAWASSDASAVKTALALQNVTNESKATMFTSPVFTGTPTFTLTSDATGDIFYRNSSGYFTRLTVGTIGQRLGSNGTIPGWVASDTAGLGTSLAAKAFLTAVLKNADSTSIRNYSNILYLKNADSTSIRNYSTLIYAPKSSPTFTGTVTIPTPFTLGAVSVLPTGAELNFVDGVTSAIQTQLNGKTSYTYGSTDPTGGNNGDFYWHSTKLFMYQRVADTWIQLP